MIFLKFHKIQLLKFHKISTIVLERRTIRNKSRDIYVRIMLELAFITIDLPGLERI